MFLCQSLLILDMRTMELSDRKLRYEVFTYFLEMCRSPTIAELVDRLTLTEAEVKQGLEKLEDLHHLVLYQDGVPSPTPIHMAHPFSHL